MRSTGAYCEERLDEVKAPTLVVMGSKGPDFKNPGPEAEGLWLSEKLSGSLLMVEGAGHYPHAEMPGLVGPAIVGFLRK